jgi:hypothetical protein
VRGSVVKRGEGYSVVVDLDRDPITRKRRQRWHSGYRTRGGAGTQRNHRLGARRKLHRTHQANTQRVHQRMAGRD